MILKTSWWSQCRHAAQQRLETHWVTAWKAPEKALNASDLIQTDGMDSMTRLIRSINKLTADVIDPGLTGRSNGLNFPVSWFNGLLTFFIGSKCSLWTMEESALLHWPVLKSELTTSGNWNEREGAQEQLFLLTWWCYYYVLRSCLWLFMPLFKKDRAVDEEGIRAKVGDDFFPLGKRL